LMQICANVESAGEIDLTDVILSLKQIET